MKKLIAIQADLKAPKGNYNSFGKYNYRSCEDILEAVKPLLVREECILIITDDIVQIGDRFYVKATARITDGTETMEVTAFAREEKEKKGMDGSQVTGTASSYARKYALNGLFLIDDNKDADTDEYANAGRQAGKPEQPAGKPEPLATEAEKKIVTDRCKQLNVSLQWILQQVGVTGQMTKEQHGKALIILKDIEESRKA